MQTQSNNLKPPCRRLQTLLGEKEIQGSLKVFLKPVCLPICRHLLQSVCNPLCIVLKQGYTRFRQTRRSFEERTYSSTWTSRGQARSDCGDNVSQHSQRGFLTGLRCCQKSSIPSGGSLPLFMGQSSTLTLMHCNKLILSEYIIVPTKRDENRVHLPKIRRA